jgi:MFS family permease
MNMIRTLAESLVGIFLPIFIFTIGTKTPLFHTDTLINGLIWVIVYYLLRSLTTTIVSFIGLPLLFRILRFKGSILFANLAQIGEMILWLFASAHPWLLFIAGILRGIMIVFYWIPYHTFFDQKARGRDGHFGKQVGLRIVLGKGASALGPLLGGFIIALYGFSVLFVISIILLVVSAVPTLIAVTENHHHKHTMKIIYKDYLLNPKFKLITTAFAGASLDATIFGIFWPILLLVVVESYTKIGILSSFSTAASIIAALYVGWLIDRVGGGRIHLIGVIINTLLYLPRMVLRTAAPLYVLDVVDKINGELYSIPFESKTYENGVRMGGSDYFVYREIALHMPLVPILCAVIVLVSIVPDWRYVFVLSMLGSLLSYCMSVGENMTSYMYKMKFVHRLKEVIVKPFRILRGDSKKSV